VEPPKAFVNKFIKHEYKMGNERNSQKDIEDTERTRFD
jgi:hypothetical protein